MFKSPAKYQNIARQTDTYGVCTLRFPFVELLGDFAAELASNALKAVTQSESSEFDTSILEGVGLHADALDLSEFVPADTRSRLDEVNTIGDLRRLAGIAADLAVEDGQWRLDASTFDDIVNATCGEIQSRLRNLMSLDTAGLGHSALASGINHVLTALQNNHLSLRKGLRSWTPQDTAQLREIEHKISRWTTGRTLATKLVLRVFPNGPKRLLLRDAQRRDLSRMIRMVSSAHSCRANSEMVRLRSRVFEKLAGHCRGAGIVQMHLDQLDQSARPILAARGLLDRNIRSARSVRSDEILLCDSLDSIVDIHRGLTIRALFHQRLANAGFSESEWHEQIAESGIPFGHRTLRPTAWSSQSPQEIANALMCYSLRTLGAEDEHRKLNVVTPSSLTEHLAGISMLDEELAPLLTRMVSVWIQRSKPYATFDSLAGVSCVPKAFLYCHPSDRPRWIDGLSNRIEIVDPQRVHTYECSNPFAVTLFQVIQGAPAGSMRELKRWSALANENRRLGITEPLCERKGFAEIRMLSERVRNNADCEKLFDAGVSCSAISEISSGTSQFILNQNDDRLAAMFHDTRVIRIWREPEYFHSLLRRGGTFITLLRHQYSAVANLPILVSELSAEPDADVACRALADKGILEEQAGQYRLMKLPTCGWAQIPQGLCQFVRGAIRGLTKPQFVAAMMIRDRLYNAVFWAILDAWQEGHLSQKDVPDSVTELAESLTTA